MNVEILKSKIHRVTVTEANLDYIGSITIDEALMEAANILPGEHVYIVDNNNGERLETYAIPGPKNSGVICLNGAAGRHRDYYGLCLDALRGSPHLQALYCVPRHRYQPPLIREYA